MIELLPCHPGESQPGLTPEGIEFSVGSDLIQAPPGRASLGDKNFSASYEISEEKITVHLSGLRT